VVNRRAGAIVAIAIGIAVAIAVGTRSGPELIDGWPLGPSVDCARVKCEPYVRAASEELDRRSPQHAAILTVELLDEGDVDAQGVRVALRSAPVIVARLQLVDGSVRAIGLAAVPGGPWAMPGDGP
jgi:hypothetical protein